MPTIHVPEPFRPTLDRIALLSDTDLQKVREVLESLKPQIKPESMVETARSKSDLPEFDEIVQALVSLSVTRVRFAAPLDEFVRDVSRTAPSTKKNPQVLPVLEERLKSLLNLDSLLKSARAFDVQHEYEKVFRSARIVTDIRPIFDVAGSNATGAMIVHNLNITYYHNNQFEEAIFALDDADVIALKRVLERAENKAGALERIIEKTGLDYFASKE